jgi:hypothetical protein
MDVLQCMIQPSCNAWVWNFDKQGTPLSKYCMRNEERTLISSMDLYAPLRCKPTKSLYKKIPWLLSQSITKCNQVGHIEGWIKKSTKIGHFWQQMHLTLNDKEDLNPNTL